MQRQVSIEKVLTEETAQQNIITNVTVNETMIIVDLEPKIEALYERADSQESVSVHRYDSEIIVVEGLGIQGKGLRYRVKTVRLAYLNDGGQFVTFMAPLPGIRTRKRTTTR